MVRRSIRAGYHCGFEHAPPEDWSAAEEYEAILRVDGPGHPTGPETTWAAPGPAQHVFDDGLPPRLGGFPLRVESQGSNWMSST
jgi:hypothetical protein